MEKTVTRVGKPTVKQNPAEEQNPGIRICWCQHQPRGVGKPTTDVIGDGMGEEGDSFCKQAEPRENDERDASGARGARYVRRRPEEAMKFKVSVNCESRDSTTKRTDRKRPRHTVGENDGGSHTASESNGRVTRVTQHDNQVQSYWPSKPRGCHPVRLELADELTKRGAIHDKRAPVYESFPLSYASHEPYHQGINYQAMATTNHSYRHGVGHETHL